MLTDPTVHTGYIAATPHPEGGALRVELELAAERLLAATQGLIDSGLLPAPSAVASDMWHRVARRVHQEMHHDAGEPCQRCVDWTRAAMSEVQPELAHLHADVRWLRKTKTQLTEINNRLIADLAAAHGRIAVLQTAAAGLDGLADVLLNEGIADATPDQLAELAGRFSREHQALKAALAEDAPADEPEPGQAAALLDVRIMRAVTTQRDQAVNDLERVTGDRDRLANELELVAVESRLLSEANGLLSSTLDHAGEVFQDKETGKHGWRCVLCDWLSVGLDSEKTAYQDLGRHWSTVDHDGTTAREDLAALQARVQELLGPIRPELADTPEESAAEVVGL